jgi:hypothetical protein
MKSSPIFKQENGQPISGQDTSNYKNIMNKIILVLLIFFYHSATKAQLLPNGQYIGYERIHVRKATEGILVFYPGMYVENVESSIDKSWYHQVTITIHKDSVTIIRMPIYVKDNQILYSDSIGGFYYYKGIIVRLADSTIVIRAYLDSTRYMPHHGTGTPYYVSDRYSKVEAEGNKLTLQAGYLGRLTFRRIEQYCLQHAWRLHNYF